MNEAVQEWTGTERRRPPSGLKVDSWAEVGVIIALIAHVIVLTAFFVKMDSRIEVTEGAAQRSLEIANENRATLAEALGELKEQNAARSERELAMSTSINRSSIVLEELVRIVYSNHPPSPVRE